ncbi:MAG: 4-(cytidine 5'-diphospho)-2-C-methyl-D-erythritol kinase [Hyphomicrobium aestuarii]|nr:4-(cytidine 5'-diphospho)-2-C-methyl-D-erythritol kinase [Hyphomicrobium aestuarii]
MTAMRDVELAFVERAPPKVNLTLTVLGRRPADGYHELDSLVAFAQDVADTVTLHTVRPDTASSRATGSVDPALPQVTASGPFAGSIVGENLLDIALRIIATAAPSLVLGPVTLEKRLPIAAGIGGGSADAAALIRAAIRANPGVAASIDWHALAARLGADVPVCLDLRAQRMQGIGDQLTPLPHLPPLHAVLVNPLAPVPPDKTARVFRMLAAPTLSLEDGRRCSSVPDVTTRDDLLEHMRRTGNDLTRPAMLVVPDIAAVLAALGAAPGCELAQLSGGGPTCFGIFAGAAEAEAAAVSLREAKPGWWISASRLS